MEIKRDKDRTRIQLLFQIRGDFTARVSAKSTGSLCEETYVSKESLSGLHARIVTRQLMHMHGCAVVKAVCVFTERVCERSDFIIHKALVRDRDLTYASLILCLTKEETGN